MLQNSVFLRFIKFFGDPFICIIRVTKREISIIRRWLPLTQKDRNTTFDEKGLNRRPNQSNIPGGSVDEHRKMENGNILLTGKEIKQQNENL